jgi:hypothetical protein
VKLNVPKKGIKNDYQQIFSDDNKEDKEINVIDNQKMDDLSLVILQDLFSIALQI